MTKLLRTFQRMSSASWWVPPLTNSGPHQMASELKIFSVANCRTGLIKHGMRQWPTSNSWLMFVGIIFITARLGAGEYEGACLSRTMGGALELLSCKQKLFFILLTSSFRWRALAVLSLPLRTSLSYPKTFSTSAQILSYKLPFAHWISKIFD